MSRHFGAQHVRNGYAAMGKARGRPIYGGINSTKSIAQSIAEERARAKRMAAASGSKK